LHTRCIGTRGYAVSPEKTGLAVFILPAGRRLTLDQALGSNKNDHSGDKALSRVLPKRLHHHQPATRRLEISAGNGEHGRDSRFAMDHPTHQEADRRGTSRAIGRENPGRPAGRRSQGREAQR